MHFSITVFICILIICVSLFPGFIILGFFQNVILEAAPSNWLDIGEVAVSTFKFLVYSILCFLSIMLYSDLALPSALYCFYWTLSRTSLPHESLDTQQTTKSLIRRSSFSFPSQSKCINEFMDEIDKKILTSHGRKRSVSSIN